MTKPHAQKIRVLVVEDNPERQASLKFWLSDAGVSPMIASSAGVAIGILQRDAAVINGLLLDHDLHESPRVESDLNLSGTELVQSVIKYLPRQIPILVHSMNPTGAERMARLLEGAGFSVERIPMSKLTAWTISRWVDENLDLQD